LTLTHGSPFSRLVQIGHHIITFRLFESLFNIEHLSPVFDFHRDIRYRALFPQQLHHRRTCTQKLIKIARWSPAERGPAIISAKGITGGAVPKSEKAEILAETFRGAQNDPF
jgi:hypothetical protein